MAVLITQAEVEITGRPASAGLFFPVLYIHFVKLRSADNHRIMKITGFAAQGKSDFDARKHRGLIADNHRDTLCANAIAEGIDTVVQELDRQASGGSWVDMVKSSPYYITHQDA